MGVYLSGIGTLGWGEPAVGLGFLVPEILLLNFHPPQVSVGTHPFHISVSASPHFLPFWIDVVS